MKALDRNLGLMAVVGISMGAMLGSGLFVLPGLAAGRAGPSVWLAYLLASLCVLPAALSKAELATAMPTSGGTYVYLDRAFGPLAGTVAGLGLWLSLLLKSAFALIGFGAYLRVVADLPLKGAALVVLAGIVVLNLAGIRKVGQFQIVVVVAVMVGLGALGLMGASQIDPARFTPFFTEGFSGLLAAAAFVFVSYSGVTKIAAVAEEVREPERNLPLGILLSLGLVTLLYTLTVAALVGVLPVEELATDLRPIHSLAVAIGGPVIGVGAALLGIVTMISMANAGLLASSRFPFAMARDDLLPRWLREVHPRRRTPTASIVATGITMALAILFLDVEALAKLASAFVILLFMAENLALVVLRETSTQWYHPRFRSPLYPAMQIGGIVAELVLLVMLGLTALAGAAAICAIGALLFALYGRTRTLRRGELGKLGPRPDLVEAAASGKAADMIGPRPHVVVPLFGEERSPEMVIEVGAALADGKPVEVLHLTEIPEQTFLGAEVDDELLLGSLERRFSVMAREEAIDLHFSTVHTRDVIHTVHDRGCQPDTEWLVIEWHGRRLRGRLIRNPLAWLLDNLPCNLALFKDNGVRYIRQVLVYPEPGPHDSLVVATADHLAALFDAELTFVRWAEDDTEKPLVDTQVGYLDELRRLCRTRSTCKMIEGPDLATALIEESAAYDLLVLGAPAERHPLRLFHQAWEDRVVDRSLCSVLRLKARRVQHHDFFEQQPYPEDAPRSPIRRMLDATAVETGLQTSRKEELFLQIAAALHRATPEVPAATIEQQLWERERTQTTAVGRGLALPHATIDEAPRSVLGVFTTRTPLAYDADSAHQADVFLATMGPPSSRQRHLVVLSQISRLVLGTDLLDRLRQASGADEVMAIFADACRKLDELLANEQPRRKSRGRRR